MTIGTGIELLPKLAATSESTRAIAEDKVRRAIRIQKTLQDAKMKLASVATDVLGASGRTMLQAIAAGEDAPEELAQMARKGLCKNLPQVRLALEERIRNQARRIIHKIRMKSVPCAMKLDDPWAGLARSPKHT